MPPKSHKEAKFPKNSKPPKKKATFLLIPLFCLNSRKKYFICKSVLYLALKFLCKFFLEKILRKVNFNVRLLSPLLDLALNSLVVFEVRLRVEDLVLVGRHQPLERMPDHHEAGHLVEGLENCFQIVIRGRLVELVDQSPDTTTRAPPLPGVEEAGDGFVFVLHSGHVEKVDEPGARGHLGYGAVDNLVSQVPDMVVLQVPEQVSIAPQQGGISGTNITDMMRNISNISKTTGTSAGQSEVKARVIIRIISYLRTETRSYKDNRRWLTVYLTPTYLFSVLVVW